MEQGLPRRAQPHTAVPARRQGGDHALLAGTVRLRPGLVVAEQLPDRIDPQGAAEGRADPDDARPVFEQAEDLLAGGRIGIRRGETERGEAAAGGVVPEEAVPGPDPDPSARSRSSARTRWKGTWPGATNGDRHVVNLPREESSRLSPASVPTQTSPGCPSQSDCTRSLTRLAGLAGSCRNTVNRPVRRSSRPRPAHGPDPQGAAAVLEDRRDAVVGEAVRPGRFMPQDLEGAGLGIQPVQTALGRAGPQDAGRVQAEGLDHVVAEAGGIPGWFR